MWLCWAHCLETHAESKIEINTFSYRFTHMSDRALSGAEYFPL